MTEFTPFPKIARLKRACVITEKIDGTNALIQIEEDGSFFVGSRTRWITPEDDNYGFARWAYQNKEELMTMGPGRHFGEWWGAGIQKRYSILDKRFWLFNVGRWNSETAPKCCGVVPILYEGPFSTNVVDEAVEKLRSHGSVADPNCKRPEGVITYLPAANIYFKTTLEKDDEWKGKFA